MRMGDRTIQRASDSHDNHLHFIFCKRKLPRKTQRLLSMILKEISDRTIQHASGKAGTVYVRSHTRTSQRCDLTLFIQLLLSTINSSYGPNIKGRLPVGSYVSNSLYRSKKYRTCSQTKCCSCLLTGCDHKPSVALAF